MIKKYCDFCRAEHWHNRRGKVVKDKAPEWRCTNCGQPRRYTGKNSMIRLAPGGRVDALPQS